MEDFIERIKSSPISQKLIAANCFTVADTATGEFEPNSLNDHWRLHRLEQWCRLYCKNKFRRRIRMALGTVTYEFENADDARTFRRVTQRVPTLIACS
ncbi:hypothetical protein [Microvirga mediterraneensis]|uniref:Uncharacterized protein n=1 Tax=Microvirga mediterraneensis TaxID=2754695 RepID=A0A838BSQ7_9HYPH|nr:hypothetical protein [Microvirga mediterraneensis]MBA1157476.1 hypothetical protein [Microvirga mediterraneensis]